MISRSDRVFESARATARPLVRGHPTTDAAVRSVLRYLVAHDREGDAIAGAIARAALAERTPKRRFEAATGTTLIEHVQHLRVEEAGSRPAP